MFGARLCVGLPGRRARMTYGAVTISPDPFLAIVAASALAGTIAVAVRFGSVVVPTVVLELVFGILLGPEVLGIKVTPPISFFADLGLGLLFFFAGYELDLRRVAGACRFGSGSSGWAMSLAIAYGVGAILAATGVVLSLLYTGSAPVTTAIGTLLPIIVSDAGELRTRLGTYLLAAGSVGEIGPVLLLTLFLSAQGTLHDALIPARVRRRRRRDCAVYAASVEAHDSGPRANAGAQLPARRALDDRSDLRPRLAGLPPRPRPPPRRLRRPG